MRAGGDELTAAIRDGLQASADPTRAPAMQAYMKSAMPFLGVRLPQVRAVVRTAVRAARAQDPGALRAAAVKLWDAAEFREQRYAATALLALARVEAAEAEALVALYQDLIVSGAWWDHVDELAHRVRDALLVAPEVVRPTILDWRLADDRWLRRVSVICQVGAKGRTDTLLLADAIEANAADRDFFLRKAIGWALRDYARTDPDWVRGFVDTHDLSPLSVREATKHL